MTPDAVATATAPAVSVLPSHFMLDPVTYQRGAELGFAGLDFYTVGRGGALGPVHADVVAAAFVFFSPPTVAEAWERGCEVMAPADAARHFMALGHDWAEAHLSDDVDLPRLADLLAPLVAGANPAAAPLFGAWRAQPEPGPDRPQALVLHRLNLLRELRNALHGATVLAHGLTPHEAVSIRAPHMLGIFGYDGPHLHASQPGVQSEWAAAEADTDRAMGPVYAVLDEDERVELSTLLTALHAPFAG